MAKSASMSLISTASDPVSEVKDKTNLMIDDDADHNTDDEDDYSGSKAFLPCWQRWTNLTSWNTGA